MTKATLTDALALLIALDDGTAPVRSCVDGIQIDLSTKTIQYDGYFTGSDGDFQLRGQIREDGRIYWVARWRDGSDMTQWEPFEVDAVAIRRLAETL